MRVAFLAGLLLTTAFLLPGCRRGAPAAAPAANQPAPFAAILPLPESAVVYYDNRGGIQDSVRLVIRDAAALREAWARATSTQSTPPPSPEVDFARDMVLLVAAGRMTPEDQIRVDSAGVRQEVDPAGARRMLEVVVRTVEGCRRFNSDAYPLALVRVPRFDGTVRFVERRERAQGCDAR